MAPTYIDRPGSCQLTPSAMLMNKLNMVSGNEPKYPVGNPEVLWGAMGRIWKDGMDGDDRSPRFYPVIYIYMCVCV